MSKLQQLAVLLCLLNPDGTKPLLAEDGGARVALLGSGAVPRAVPASQAHQGFHLLCGFVLQLGLLQAHHISILCLHQLLDS